MCAKCGEKGNDSYFSDLLTVLLFCVTIRNRHKFQVVKHGSRDPSFSFMIIYLFIFSFGILYQKNSLRLLYLFFDEVLFMFELFLVFSYLYIEHCTFCDYNFSVQVHLVLFRFN